MYTRRPQVDLSVLLTHNMAGSSADPRACSGDSVLATVHAGVTDGSMPTCFSMGPVIRTLVLMLVKQVLYLMSHLPST